MSRPLRIEYEGALHHVMSRGNARQAIVLDDEDRAAWITALARTAERFGWVIWAYCLMDNHYHLLVETPNANLSRGMRELNGVFTQSFNRRHGRVGHLFQGRFKALVVDKDAYLLELCRYVVLNPVRAGMVEKAIDWRWSSHRVVMARAIGPKSLCVDKLLALFGSEASQQRRAYSRFVSIAAGVEDPMDLVQNQVFLGGDAFVEKVARVVSTPGPEVPKRQRRLRSLRTMEREASDRDAAIREAYGSGHYSLKEIGAHFALHYSTISRIARST